MKIWMTMLAAVMAFGAIATASQAADVKSLRGTTPLDQDAPAVDIHKPDTGQMFGRAYRQQPPMIPHTIDAYQIDLKANQCIGCHDWPQNTVANAPKISETHYIGRSGERLNHVSTQRWFCTQCHVPQLQAEPLVKNDFKSAADMF